MKAEWEFRPSVSRFLKVVEKDIERIRLAVEGKPKKQFGQSETELKNELRLLGEQKAGARDRINLREHAEDFMNSDFYSEFVKKLDSMSLSRHAQLCEGTISGESYAAAANAIREIGLFPSACVRDGITALETLKGLETRADALKSDLVLLGAAYPEEKA